MRDLSKERISTTVALSVSDVLAVVSVTFLIALYFVLRYGGLWMENDTAALTDAIRSVAQTGELAPSVSGMYSSGYAYQTIGAIIAAVTGISVGTLQQLILPFGIILLAGPAILLFYDITGSRQSAVIGSILLFTSPEFLFVVLRGSHEKFGRLLMILALLLLFRSFKSRERVGHFITYTALFYLAVYGMLASNFLISFSFIFALVLGLLAGVLLERFRMRANELVGTTTERLALAAPLCFILAFLLMFYFYPPVQYSLRALNSIFDQTRALLLGSEATNVYEGVLGAWISPAVYTIINLPNWLILFGSFLFWCSQGWRWVVKRQEPKSRTAWLLWLLYGAFGFQAALSIVTDASGVFGNLQHRLFPSFALLGVAMVIDSLGGWLNQLPRTRLVQASLSTLVFLLALFSLLKATNEAALVNTWPFYRPPELRAMQWYDGHTENGYLWAGFGSRLPDAFAFDSETRSSNYVYRFSYEDMPYILISDITRLQSARTKIPLPDTARYQAIYDNGMTQLFYRRAVTPYQR